MNPPIEKSIASLCSTDFQISRQAQMEIVSAGKPALPLLLEQVHFSDNQQQVALCFYLIGELDGATYTKRLLESGAPGRLCLLLRYPNREAIKRLPDDQWQELQKHLQKNAQLGTIKERACIEKALLVLNGTRQP